MQGWTPLPEQIVIPGTHTPPHAPLVHAYGHALAGPHVPEAVHVCTPLAPPSAFATQLVAFGAHTPWHDAAPLEPTHAWLPQSTGFPHWPAVHVWSPLPEHW